MKTLTILFFSFLLSGQALSSTTSGCVSGDCINGFGEYLYRGGDRYTGFWKEGIRYGRGTYRFADGSVFVGDYANDRRHGAGTHTSANGHKMTARWVDGVMVNSLRRTLVMGQQPVFTSRQNGMLLVGNVDESTTNPLLYDEALTPDQKDVMEAEALQVIRACTGYTDDTIEDLAYLYSIPNSDFDDLYFRFKAYNEGSHKRPAGVLAFVLKLKKHHSGIYEAGIDSGRYYWGNCKPILL